MTQGQIIRDIATYPGETIPMHHWSMIVGGEVVSELWVDMETGEIMQVATLPGHQGNGYASALYQQAASEITIYHAPASHRTYEGDRFARSVGGESLPCLHGCCDDTPDR